MEIIKKQNAELLKASNIQLVNEKYLQPVLEVLDKKNIQGVSFIKQDNKIMLIFDKQKLSSINSDIINAMSVGYPNMIVGINDINHPFDYAQLYETEGEKRPNRKARPSDVFEFSMGQDDKAYQYYRQYQFAGIEIDTTSLDKVLQLGCFLEFINALQEQNPIGEGKVKNKIGVEVYTNEQLKRYDHYIKQGEPDLKPITVLLKYNEKIEEFLADLKLKNDPYFIRGYIVTLGQKSKEMKRKIIRVEVTQDRLLENVYQYVESKKQEESETKEIPKKQEELEEIKNLIEGR